MTHIEHNVSNFYLLQVIVSRSNRVIITLLIRPNSDTKPTSMSKWIDWSN